jgi:hypothetical protein
MRKRNTYAWLIGVICLFASPTFTFAQETLPSITVNCLNRNVVVSWLNEYKKPVQNILIQRSFDSTKNFSTIGSVLTPQNLENGYPDRLPPYDRMYYRVMINFEGGEYVIGPSRRAFPSTPSLPAFDLTKIPEPQKNTEIESEEETITLNKDRSSISSKRKRDSLKVKQIQERKLTSVHNTEPIQIVETAYPSSRVYTNKQNVVVIAIQQAYTKKYGLKVFDENQKLILELKRVPDDYLLLEKSNFFHAGWFNFEIYEEGKLFEKNRFFVAKDKGKSN